MDIIPCSYCGKPVNEKYKCPSCEALILKARQKRSYNKHIEKRRAEAREYYDSHKEEKALYNKKYSQLHRDEIKSYMQEYRKTHKRVRPIKEKKITKKWRYENDPEYRKFVNEKRNAYWREKRKSLNKNTSYRLVLRMWRHEARCKAAGIELPEGMVYVQKEDLIRLHSWQRNMCYVCNKPFGRLGTVEHIIPHTLGGPWVSQNIVYTCETCNFSRQEKYLHVEWEPCERFTLPEDHAYLSQNLIMKSLGESGIQTIPFGKYGVILEGKSDRLIFVLSTFAVSERNPPMAKLALELHKLYPEAIILFDYEWYGRYNNVINMLKSKIGIADRVGARKFSAELIGAQEARAFLDQHHLMGFGTGTHYVGLKDSENILWGVGSFKKEEEKAENIRLAFRGHVSGGMSKIMSYFRKTVYNGVIESFVDSRYADGSGHETIGFENIGITPPTYKWVFPDKVQHYRYLSNQNKQTKNLLRYREDLSAKENISMNGVYKLWTLPLHKIRFVPE